MAIVCTGHCEFCPGLSIVTAGEKSSTRRLDSYSQCNSRRLILTQKGLSVFAVSVQQLPGVCGKTSSGIKGSMERTKTMKSGCRIDYKIA